MSINKKEMNDEGYKTYENDEICVFGMQICASTLENV